MTHRRCRYPGWKRIALLSSVLVACGSEAETVFVPWPGDASGTTLLGVETADARPQLHVVDPTTPFLLPDLAQTLSVLKYDAPNALELPEGPVELATDGGREIKQPDARFLWRVGESDEWRSFASPLSIEQLMLPPLAARCPRIETVKTFELPGALEEGQGALAIGGGVLLVVGDGQAFRVDAERLTPIEVSIPDFAFDSATRLEGSGELWFGTKTGELYSGVLDGDRLELRLRADLPKKGGEDVDRVRWLRGRDGASGLEVYTMDITGIVGQFDGNGWTQLHDFELADNTTASLGGLVLVDEALYAAAANQDVVLRRVAGQNSFEPFPLATGATGLEWVDGFGLVVGGADGSMALRGFDGQWTALPDSKVSNWAQAFHGLEVDGFVVGLAFGTMTLYMRNLGFCDPLQGHSGDVFFFAPLGNDRFVAFGDRAGVSSALYATVFDVR